jgi:hypothetical protein
MTSASGHRKRETTEPTASMDACCSNDRFFFRYLIVFIAENSRRPCGQIRHRGGTPLLDSISNFGNAVGP